MDKDWYFIGLWLGDGAKDACSITTADNEIIEYLQNLALRLNLKCSLYKDKRSKAIEVNISGNSKYTKEVFKYDLEGNFIEKYSSLKEAASCNNINNTTSISHCAKGRYNHAGGFKWKIGKVDSHNIIRDWLIQLNLLNNKHIPIEIFSETNENKKKFLSGIIDSDGSTDHNTISISQKDKSFLEFLWTLCNELDYKGRLTEYVHPNGQSYYKLILKGDLRDLPLLLNRKRVTKVTNSTKLVYI